MLEDRIAAIIEEPLPGLLVGLTRVIRAAGAVTLELAADGSPTTIQRRGNVLLQVTLMEQLR